MAELKSTSACRRNAWSISTWPLAEPADQFTVPFRCQSWRHAGECREWKGAQDFARCKQVLENMPAWAHLVLTFADHKTRSIYHTYKAGFLNWSVLRKRIQRRYGDLVYIQTWERHEDGVPHCHTAICNRYLFDNCPYTRRDHPKAFGHWNFEALLQKDALEIGFGERGWIEPIRSGDGMAKYLSKLNRELTGHARKDQTPENAPPGFRRLRATTGLLPPRLGDPDISGCLNFCDEFGEEVQ